MKKTILMIVLFTVSSLSVTFAQTCPDFSGKYVDVEDSYPQLTIIQNGCKSIQFLAGDESIEISTEGKLIVLQDGSEYPWEYESNIDYWELNYLVGVNKHIFHNLDGEYPGQDIELIETTNIQKTIFKHYRGPQKPPFYFNNNKKII